MHEFSLDKPIVKDIVGSGRGNLNIDWVLDKMKIYWPGKIEIVNLKKKKTGYKQHVQHDLTLIKT